MSATLPNRHVRSRPSHLKAVDKKRPLFIERPNEMWEFVGESYEDHVKSWQDIDGEVQKDKWKLSSVAASLDTKYKDKTIDKFAHEAHRSPRRIREYAQTYRAFANSERSPNLSFHHHTVASTATDPAKAIHKAEEHNWSTRDLEKWIKTGLAPGEEEYGPHEDETKVLQTPEAQEWLNTLSALLANVPPAPSNAPFLKNMIQAMERLPLQQLKRTIEGDCRIIMKAIEETGGLSGDDLFDWHTEHFYFTSEDQLESRLLTMVMEKKLVEDDAGPFGRQANRRGALPKWYVPFYTKRKEQEGAMCKVCEEWHRDPSDCLELSILAD